MNIAYDPDSSHMKRVRNQPFMTSAMCVDLKRAGALLMFAFLTDIVKDLVWYVDSSDGALVIDLHVLLVSALGRTASAAKSLVSKKLSHGCILRKFRVPGTGLNLIKTWLKLY